MKQLREIIWILCGLCALYLFIRYNKFRIKISVKIKIIDRPNTNEESCSGWDKDSGDIKNAEIRVITKKLWYVEVSRQKWHDTGNRKNWVYNRVIFSHRF